MPKATKTTRTRSKVKGLPKAEKELTAGEARRVKGGLGINWGDGTVNKKAAVKDGTSNTILVGEAVK